MSVHAAIPAELRRVCEASQRHSLRGFRTRELIQSANALDGIFRAQPAGATRSHLAESLIGIYDEMNRRIRSAPLGARSLPQLEGVTWNPGDALAGTVEAILPFGQRDLWIASLQQNYPVRQQGQQPRTAQPPRVVNMPDETVRGRRPTGAPALRDPSQVDGLIPSPGEAGVLGDLAGWLDSANSSMGLGAMVLESFAMDVFGTLAGAAISVFGLIATWAERDRQVARLHSAHQTCVDLYDMSGPFRDENLFRRPYSQWPAIRQPMAPVLPAGQSNDAQIERRVRGEANQRVYRHILNLEQHPVYRVLRMNGRDQRVPVTGKIYLYLLNVHARRANQSVLHYLRYAMQRQSGLNLGVFRW